MVFMEDSERAAAIARDHGVDAGLHVNLTTPFNAPRSSSRLIELQQKVSRFLRWHHLAPAIYHPGLAASFDYVVKAQIEEFERLYGTTLKRVDGHHHMHLCANVVFQDLLPLGSIVPRNFSFKREEKGCINRIYRRWQDRWLARRHRLTDFFFALSPGDPSRMERICDLASRCNVEVETHPAKPEEYAFLMDGELLRLAGKVSVARGYVLRPMDRAACAGATA
jgi:hypothetical protein